MRHQQNKRGHPKVEKEGRLFLANKREQRGNKEEGNKYASEARTVEGKSVSQYGGTAVPYSTRLGGGGVVRAKVNLWSTEVVI